MKKKIIILIIFIILIFIYIFSLYKVLNWFKDNYHTIKINNILKGIPNIDIQNNDDNKKQEIDFKKLKEINSDIVGLIKVNNTNINYPFVHYKDNSFYLNHSLDKKHSEAGWVFLDYRNDINNLSKNNIIYAHSRLDKSMFGTLKNILNEKWYTNEDNQYIEMITEKENIIWQVFSVYHIENEDYYITTDFKDNEFLKFINIISNRSIYNFNVDVNENDTILTLSSCYKTNEKVVLHAKLIIRD